MHCVQRHRRVDQRFALFDRRRLHPHVHHIRPEPFACQLKAGLCPRRVFKEHVDLCQPRQRVPVFAGLPVQRHIVVRQIKQRRDVVWLELLDPQKVPVREGHGLWSLLVSSSL